MGFLDKLISVTVAVARFVVLIVLAAVAMNAISYFSAPVLARSFALGAVSDTTARVWVRRDHGGEVGVVYCHTLEKESLLKSIANETLLDGNGKEGCSRTPLKVFDNSTDFVGVFVIDGLEPNHTYRYAPWPLKNSYNLSTERGREDAWKWAGSMMLNFTTSPPPGVPANFSFIFGSCFMGVTWFTPLHIFKTLRTTFAPAFALLIGDSIYYDMSTGEYDVQYKRVLADSHLSEFMHEVPTYFQYDDHELFNDYDGGNTEVYIDAMRHYNRYLGSRNPTPYAGEQYYDFNYGGANFFVVDGRRYRTVNSAKDNENKTLLGVDQMQHLKEWLLRTSGFKFLVSPVVFAATVGMKGDGWHDFLYERAELLDFIRENKVNGVILLTGDLHYAGHFRVGKAGLHEFSASPIRALPVYGGSYMGTLAAPARNKDDVEEFIEAGPFHFGQVLVDNLNTPPTATVRLYSYLLGDPYVIHETTITL